MSKISELGPITGANTRTEDLFVIVNLIQGDDGTKNITRAELVQAIQYEIFDRITITGGTISGVLMSDSTLNTVTINDSIYNRGTINLTVLNDVTIETASGNNVTLVNSTIDDSDFSNGTGNNNVFTNTIVDNGQLNNSTGNNNVFTNSRIDDSEYNNVTIDQGTANGLILTNIEIDELILEDAFISNSEIVTTSFSEGEISNSTIFNVDLDDVDITNSRFSNGQIWDTAIANSTVDNVVITNSEFNQGSIDTVTANGVTMVASTISGSDFSNGTSNNVAITNSDFSDGTGNNNVFTNTTVQGRLEDSVIANSAFQGSMNDVEASNLRITSSSASGFEQTKSTFEDGAVKQSTFDDGIINDSRLVDFDMELTNSWEPNMDEDSYFAIKNVKTGDTEQITYRQFFNEISKSTEKALKVHVAVDGDDNNPGTILKPVQTLARASELAIEKAGGNVNRNALNNAVHISVGPGTYYVDEPIALPDDCAMTSTAGQYATVIQKKPGWERTNGVLVGSGCYVQGFAYMNFEVDNFDYPEGGFAVAYRPGATLRRSPYIRDSSQLSNFNRLDVEPPLNPFNSKGTIADLGQEFIMEAGHSAEINWAVDDEVTFSSGASGYISWSTDIDSESKVYVRNLKGNVQPGDFIYTESGGTGQVKELGIDDFPNRLVGRGGGCMLADRRVLDTDSLFTYVLCFGFTPRTQNGMGYVARDGAGVNGIGSLSIFVRTAFYALNGGQMTLNNSGTQFGDISMRAKGSTNVFTPSQTDEANIISNTAFGDVLIENKEEIIEDMITYLTANTADGGLGYQGYDSEKCRRDTGIIVDNVGYDVALNSNYWGRLNGITYRSPISYVVVNEQLTETVAANEHLKSEINRLFANANTVVNTRVNQSLDETINILKNGEPYASDIVFTDTGVPARTNARELIQDNRDLIIDGMVDWIDNNPEFFSYDSIKCQRDIKEYILPAVKYDMMLDTNYNSITAGNAYYFKQSVNVIENQRDETVASFERLRKVTDELIEANSAIGAVRSYDKFNNVIEILGNTGKKFTPTGATYDPASGEFTMTIGTHDLTVGRYITIADAAFTFSCNTDGNVVRLSHPRSTDPAYRAALPILEVTDTTVTVNVGSTGYKGVHTFIEAELNSIAVLGEEIYFSDDAAIPADNRNARKQLQSNKEFVQDYMMGWTGENFFVYDSDKCQRDTKEYILPAVERDMVTGSNFMSIQTGIAYRGKTGEVVINDQNSQTVGSFVNLKQDTADLLSDSIALERSNTSFDEFINIIQTDGKTFTPTDATYDPASGVFSITIPGHEFEVNDEVLLLEEGITFSCANTATGIVTEISHPRETDPAYRTLQTITAVNGDTITMNVGNAGGYTEPHTFVRAKKGAVQEAAILNGTYTPTDVAYDPVTGEMILTLGSHNYEVGDQIIIEGESITFTCGPANTEITHPRTTDPAYETPLAISAVTSTTITVNPGNANGYTEPHTFVFAKPNCIKTHEMYTGRVTPTDATYDPITGDMTVTIGKHNLSVGKWISIDPESMTFECANTVANTVVEITHPRTTDPAHKEPVRISGVTDTTFTVNTGNANGYTGEHTFVSANRDCIDTNAVYWTDAAKSMEFYTPTDADYNPATGVMEITIGTHNLTTDDHIQFKPGSMVFSCANTVTSEVVEIAHPRIGEPSYDLPLEITAVSANTITVNPGTAGGYTGTHTFVRADADALAKVTASTQGTYARKQLQANKTFLQDEVNAWLRDNYFVYNDKKCSRDTGYILDAVWRDVLTGSNVNSVFAGLAYRSGNASANTVINEQLTETVGAITWLKGEIASNLSSNTSISRSNAAFDEIIDIMENGRSQADARTFGNSYVSEDANRAREILQLNKEFIIDEATAFIDTNHPNLVYNVASCERDLGYFIDAVSWDIQNGSNAATVSNTRLYFDNAVGVLADDEITPTAETYEYVAQIAGEIVRAQVVDALQANTQVRDANTAFTPVDATYDPITGIMTVDLGAPHNIEANDYVTIDEESITFSCANTATGFVTPISHPRSTDPAFNKPIMVESVTANTITLDVNDAGGYEGVHTFVSANANAIRLSVSPEVSNDVQELFETVAKVVRGDSVTDIPAIVNPEYTTATSGYNADITVDAKFIAGSVPKYQTEIIEFIRDNYNGLGYDTELCYRDIGYIVDAVSEDIEYGGNAATINAAKYYFENVLLPVGSNQEIYGSTQDVNIQPRDLWEPTRLAYEHLADTIDLVVRGVSVTPTTGNSTSQDTSGVAGDTTIATAAKALANIVSDVVDDFTNSKIPAVSGAPTIAPSRTYARKSLQKNKKFIQDEVVAYIDDQFFTFDENKCARDTAYILDAVRRDVQTGATYNGLYAGKAYRAGTVGTDKVVEEQLAETIEGINFLQADIEARLTGTALTRATASFENIKDAMTNDYDAATVGYNFGVGSLGSNYINARTGLQLNRAFLQAEAIAYVNANFGSLIYNQAKCERDVGYMVDAVSYDIQHGSNVAMRNVARLYFENGISTLPADQRAPTADLYNHLATVSQQVLNKQNVTTSAGFSGPSQSTSFGPVAGAIASDSNDLWTIIADIIIADSLIDMPAAVEADTDALSAALYDYDVEAAIIAGRVSTLANQITDYLKATFDYLEYDKERCRRDTGYMVDAISHDIQYGGNAAMWNAAQIYFVNAVNLLPPEQRVATKKAFTHLGNVVRHIVRNEDVTVTSGNTNTQDKSNLAARRSIANEARDLAWIVANIADDNDPSNIPARIEPLTTWVQSDIVAEKEIIERNTVDLTEALVNFISNEYKGLSYPEEKCRRDVGIMIDAISHDINYSTNHATRLAANMYFQNAISTLPYDQRKQTADFYDEMAELLSDIVQEINVENPLYTLTTQDLTGTAANANTAQTVEGLVRIVEDAIRRDSLDAVPALIEPDTSWVDNSLVWAAEQIDNNLDILADDVTTYINTTFDVLDYNKAKCRRDAGYLLDAFSFDLNYGGNSASRWNADFYFWNNIFRIPEDQRLPTAQAYRKLGELTRDAVLGKLPGQVIKGDVSSEAEAQHAYELGEIFYVTFLNNDTQDLGPTILPDFDWEDNKIFKFSRDILREKRKVLQSETVRFVGSEFKFFDLNLARRDAGNLIQSLSNDFKYENEVVNQIGNQVSTRTYTAAFFNYNGEHVFPVFNPTTPGLKFKGTLESLSALSNITGQKPNQAYIVSSDYAGNRYAGDIYYWNGVNWISDGANNTFLLESFKSAWERMRDFIKTNYSPAPDHSTMIDGLINDILISSVLRPSNLTFGSLVESIAHQFNGASAGVNRNALPINFRNLGLPISAIASVLSEDGGRVRWSGADELNNQYFARGLRINGRTGRIEGRPFTSSVRKLARRASNSRAVV